METVNQIILAKSVNIFRRKSSSEQTKQSTDSEIIKKSLRFVLIVHVVQYLEVVSGSDVSILALAKITKQNKKKIFGLQLAE